MKNFRKTSLSIALSALLVSGQAVSGFFDQLTWGEQTAKTVPVIKPKVSSYSKKLSAMAQYLSA